MKRYTIIILALILTALAVILPVFASNTGGFAASVDPAVVAKDQEVTITVSLSKFSAVESIAVTFGEPAGLELTGAAWKQAGSPSNVDTDNGRAVWASEKAKNMYSSTDVFALTYRVTACPAGNETTIPVEIKVIVEQGGSKFEETLSVTVTVAHTGGEADCENAAKCEKCGKSYGEALGHTWADATCTDPKTCAVCGDTEGEAKGHNWADATCTDPKTCTVCGETEGEELGHDWTDATCTAPKTCTVCGKTEGTAKGHDWAAPTCTDPATCKNCGDEFGVPNGHTPGAAVKENEVAPTCTVDGSYDSVVYCTVCGEELNRETKSVAAHGHTPGVAVKENEVAPTCTVDGSYDTVVSCTVCKAEQSRTTVPVAALGHTPGVAVKENEVAPTCTVDGSYDSVVYCTVCQTEQTRKTVSVAATGHSETSVVTAPTCTEQGYTTHTCSVCGYSYANNYVSALDHAFGDWTTTTAPTCTQNGQQRRDCSRCDHYETRTATAIGHNTVNTVYDIGKESTCLTSGIRGHYKCETCGGLFLMDNAVDPLRQVTAEELVMPAHTLVDYVQVNPTCTTAGVKAHKKCEGCIKYFIDGVEVKDSDLVITANGHDYDAVVTAPTCTAQGFTTYTCHCGHTYKDNYVDMVAHAYGEWTIVTAATCTKDGQARRDCANCDAFETKTLTAPGHQLTQHAAKAATCTEGGWKAYETCGNCDYSTKEETPATGHSYKANVTAPTCTLDGYTTHTCAACGHNYKDSQVKALGHDYGAWTNVTAATCTKDGQERRDCSRCDAFETRKVDATGHSYTAKVTAPTCTEKGFTTYTCHCGHTYKDNYVNVVAHAYGAWTTVTAATCTKAGEERQDCADCDHFATRVVEATGHKLIQHEAKDATETEEGWNAYETCENCNYTTIVKIPAKGHDYTSVVTAPTCTEKGYTTHTCACGHSYVDSYVDALGHTWGEWNTTTKPTCTKAGEERRDCADCDHYETKPVAALGHKYDSVVTAPTCTAQGFTTYTCHCGHTYNDNYVDTVAHAYGDWETTMAATCTKDGKARRDCANCEAFETKTMTAPGHKLTQHAAKAATCTEGGWKAYETCGNCDYSTKEETPATGHSYKANVTAPTCTLDGYTTHTCDACGHNYKDSQVKALGHDYGAWTTVTAATCTKTGEERRGCSRCDAFETRKVDATGHSYNSVVTAPTCTAQGYTTHTCHCGDSYKDNYVKELGHAYGDWTVIKAPTCTEQGDQRRDCSRCDAFESRKTAVIAHSYTAKVTASTCTGRGYTTYTCVVCGHSYIDNYVDVVAHNTINLTYVAGTNSTCLTSGIMSHYKCETCGGLFLMVTADSMRQVTAAELVMPAHRLFDIAQVDPTCTTAGVKAHKKCEGCVKYFIDGVEVKASDLVIAATGHSYTAKVTAPTCTEKGYTTHTCHCGHSYTDTYVDAKSHTEVTDKAVAPTCTATGLTEGKHCSVCNVILVAQKEVAATGHNYTSVVTAPTCTAKGYTTYTCHCGHSYTDTYVDAKGHTPGAAATCTTAQTCTVCNAELAPAKGHTEVIDKAVAPTCTATGKTEGKHCSVCNVVLVAQKEVAATGHNYTSVVTAPTCTEKGYTTHTCSSCGASYTSDHKEALGHKDEDGNILCDTCGALLGEIKVELKPEFTEDAVSEELKDSGFDTVEKIEEEMQTQIQEELKLPDEEEPVELKETVLYDAVLMYKDEEGKLQEADKEHFPEDGKLTVTLPIPEGTDPLTHKYHVVHMFTTAEYGRNPGDVEIFTDLIARPDGNGGYYITFEVTGLSPMMVCVQERRFCEGEHSLTDWYVAVPSTSTEKGEQRRHCEECDYYEPKESNLLGDVNGDGQINTRDAKLIMQYELGLVDESKLDLLAADVNGDGQINTRDAKLIMQFELGIIDLFPVEKKK